MHYFGGDGFFTGFGMIWMVLWWVLLIAAIVALVKWLLGPSVKSGAGDLGVPPAKTAVDILKERYARGEIDQEEFREKLRDLGGE